MLLITIIWKLKALEFFHVKFFKYNVGELWCFFGSFIPLILLFLTTICAGADKLSLGVNKLGASDIQTLPIWSSWSNTKVLGAATWGVLIELANAIFSDLSSKLAFTSLSVAFLDLVFFEISRWKHLF